MIKTLLMTCALAPSLALASPFKGTSNDAELSAPTAQTDAFVSENLRPDRVDSIGAQATLEIQVLREDHGKLLPVIGLPFTQGSRAQATDDEGRVRLAACSGNEARAVWHADLKTPYFSIGTGQDHYTVDFDTACTGKFQAVFKADSPAGQVIGIWQVALRAQRRLQSAVGLSFWTSPVEFVFPDDADYYNFGQVHISRGDQWDVVGHELGHAIYDLGDLGQFGGGEHKIDQCYSTEMAISEGWASFFSAWISIPLDDEDAKFEYMVPRRAPLRIEAIPADVCRGEHNEWRVTGFFWDLIDMHDDGEKSWQIFGESWKALLGKRVSSALDAKHALERAGIDPVLLQALWDLNF
jgi:hypothetical protein